MERRADGYGEFRHPCQDGPRLAAGRLHLDGERIDSISKTMIVMAGNSHSRVRVLLWAKVPRNWQGVLA